MYKKIHSIPSLFIIFCVAFIVSGFIIYNANQDIVLPENNTNLSTSAKINWKNYSNLTYNYTVKRPSEWDIEVSENYTKFVSPDFNLGKTPDKKIEKGYLVQIRVLPKTSHDGYSGEADNFSTKKEFKIGNYAAEEFIIKNIDATETAPPAEIKFETNSNLVLIDGWFASQDKKEFLDIFEETAKSFKVI